MVRPGYVYAFAIDGSFQVKIGYTSNPVRYRFLAVQNAIKKPLILIYAVHVGFPQMIEQKLHNLFQDLRLQGEWFQLDRETIEELPSLMEWIGCNPNPWGKRPRSFLGKSLKSCRERRGWTIERLSRKAKVHKEILHACEEKGSPVFFEVAMRLARALGVSLDYLVGMYADEDDPEAHAAERSSAYGRLRIAETAPGTAWPGAVGMGHAGDAGAMAVICGDCPAHGVGDVGQAV